MAISKGQVQFDLGVIRYARMYLKPSERDCDPLFMEKAAKYDLAAHYILNADMRAVYRALYQEPNRYKSAWVIAEDLYMSKKTLWRWKGKLIEYFAQVI